MSFNLGKFGYFLDLYLYINIFIKIAECFQKMFFNSAEKIFFKTVLNQGESLYAPDLNYFSKSNHWILPTRLSVKKNYETCKTLRLKDYSFLYFLMVGSGSELAKCYIYVKASLSCGFCVVTVPEHRFKREIPSRWHLNFCMLCKYIQYTVSKVLADFAVCDWWRYCKALYDVKFRQIEGIVWKFLHIELSNTYRHQLNFLTV